jgi:glutaredoxin
MKFSRRRHLVGVLMIMVSVLVLCAGNVDASGKKGKKTVWMVFFSSRDCSKCENVKDLIEILKLRYPVKVRQFDTSKENDYAVFKTVEAIHGSGNFAVPLIMLGDSIIIGEQEITKKLEKAVRNLVARGGAPSPYIGPVEPKRKSQGIEKNDGTCESCSRGGKPPPIGDELRRVRKLLDRVF